MIIALRETRLAKERGMKTIDRAALHRYSNTSPFRFTRCDIYRVIFSLPIVPHEEYVSTNRKAITDLRIILGDTCVGRIGNARYSPDEHEIESSHDVS